MIWLTCLLSGSAALTGAEESSSTDAAPPAAAGVFSQLQQQYDADGDGVLTGEERAKAAKDVLERFDANRDGLLDDRERARALGAFGAQEPAKKNARRVLLGKLAKRLDHNADGVFDEKELARAERMQQANPEVRRLLREIQAAFDADGDGKLSAAEWGSLNDEWKKLSPATKRASFDAKPRN